MVEFLNRYVSIEKESSYGSEPSGTPVYGEVDDESLASTYDLMTRQDMSRPIAAKSVTGTERSEGDINLAIQVDDFVGNLLYSFFPQDALTTSGAAKIHTMTEPSLTDPAAGVYPSWTVRVGREEKEHTFTGMMTNSLSISATVGEYAMMSVGFVGQRESGTAALETTNVVFAGAALDALHFANGQVSFDDGSTDGSAVATVKSFSFDINLNRDTDNAYGLGDSTYRRAPPAQRREISGTIEFNKVIYTSSAAEPTYDALVAEDGLAYNDGAAPSLKLKLIDEAGADYIDFEFYNIRFEAPEASVSGRDTNTMTVNFIGLYDDNLGGMKVIASGTNLSGTQYDA
tara:strand:- start:294 stop:1325 length:1032 start_codon:yes stop_codon:yes gene_type:complete